MTKKTTNKIWKNKSAGLSGVFIIVVIAVMVFLGMNTFLLSNISSSGRDVSTDPIMVKIGVSQAKLNQSSLQMQNATDNIQAKINQISEANVLIAGLYLSSGVLDIFKFMIDSIEYVTTGVYAMFEPIITVPGMQWVVSGLIAVLTIYIIFKLIEAISGRQKI